MRRLTIAKRRAAHHSMRTHNSAARALDHAALTLVALVQLATAYGFEAFEHLYRALRDPKRGDRRRRPLAQAKVREISTFRPAGETRPATRTL
jgi:hypothetical protein